MKIELTKEEINIAIAEYIYKIIAKEVKDITMKYSVNHNDVKDYSFICETNE